jgi:hypothetical protein
VDLELDRFSRPSYRLLLFASLVSVDSVREVNEKETFFFKFLLVTAVSRGDSERTRFVGILDQKEKDDRRLPKDRQVESSEAGNLQQSHGILVCIQAKVRQ